MHKTSLQLTGARILIVDDVPANLDMLRHALEVEGYNVMVAPNADVARQITARALPDLILLDIMMPDVDGYALCTEFKASAETAEIPVIFVTARKDSDDVLRSFAVGGEDFIVKPFNKEEVMVRVRIHLERAFLLKALQEKNEALEREIEERRLLTHERDQLAGQLSMISRHEAERWGIEEFVGQSRTIKGILDHVGMLQNAPTTSVLISGESGTGKELLARAIHFGGARRDGPFVPVNCSAVPSELAESLFFGHAEGAFTGAQSERTGFFELAHGGTLFLDEIGDMPLALQPILLRALENGRFTPVGARGEVDVDVRVVAATNADLQERIAAGHFRQDLYFRLARFVVEAPPLRERREDIPLLAKHFLELFAQEMSREVPLLSEAALNLLSQYSFPGNVRELKNIVERALMESRGDAIQPEHLQFVRMEIQGANAEHMNGVDEEMIPYNLEDAEVFWVRRALVETRGNVAAAARLLGTNRTRIYRTLAKAGEQEMGV